MTKKEIFFIQVGYDLVVNVKKQPNAAVKNRFSKTFSKNKQLASSSYQHKRPPLNFLSNTCLQSQFRAQHSLILKNFCFMHVALFNTRQPKTLFLTHGAFNLHFFRCLEVNPICNCGVIFKKTISFDDMVHFINDDNAVTYVVFDCCTTLYPEATVNVQNIKWERMKLSRSCE